MSFELSIKCSKDFDELHIKFSDGTGVVTTKDGKSRTLTPKANNNAPPKANKKSIHENTIRNEEFLDTDTDFAPVSQEKVKLPEINLDNRPVKVADELQNLDI